MGSLKLINNIINQRGTPAFNSNTIANRPAAGYVGRIFISTDTFVIQRDNGTTWDNIGGGGITGSGAAGQVAFWTGASSQSGDNAIFWDNTNKRLGLGTTTPGVRLDIHGTGVIQQLNGTTTSNAYLDFQNAGTTQWRIGNDFNAGNRLFRIVDVVGSINVLTVNSSGSISIGGTPSTARLDVVGSIRSNDRIIASYQNANGTASIGTFFNNSNICQFYNFVLGNTTTLFGFMQDNTGINYFGGTYNLFQNGNVGIGYNTPNLPLAVSGSIYQGSNTANSNFQMLCNQNFYTVGFSPNFSTYTAGPVNISVAANLGTGYVFKTAATITVNLPAASGLNNQLYFVVLTGTVVTVNRAGSDVIINTAGTSVTSLTLTGYTRVLLYCDGGTTWYQII